jgi:hypothetical protein
VAFGLGARSPSGSFEALGGNSVSLDPGPQVRVTLGSVVSKKKSGMVVVSETAHSCRRSRSFSVMQSSIATITTTATDPASRRLSAGRRTRWRGTDMHRDDGAAKSMSAMLTTQRKKKKQLREVAGRCSIRKCGHEPGATQICAYLT